MEGPRTSLERLINLILKSKDGNSALFCVFLNESEPSMRVCGCIHLQKIENNTAEFGLFAVDPSVQSFGIGRCRVNSNYYFGPFARLTTPRRFRKLLDTAERHAVQSWGVTRARMKMIACRDDLYEWYKRRGYRTKNKNAYLLILALLLIMFLLSRPCRYEKTGETEPFPDGMTDTPRRPIVFCVLERSL